MQTDKEKKYNKWIWILSIAIPVAVAALFGVSLKRLGFDVAPLSFFTAHLCNY
jgi:putative membrane protein